MAAAKLARQDATPADVSAFLAEKFRDRRPFPYERGIQKFAGMFTMVAEDSRSTTRTTPARSCFLVHLGGHVKSISTAVAS